MCFRFILLSIEKVKFCAISPGQAYLVCATPRSGSTLLCEMLLATGRAAKGPAVEDQRSPYGGDYPAATEATGAHFGAFREPVGLFADRLPPGHSDEQHSGG